MYNSSAICALRCIALLFIYAPTYVNKSIIWKYLPLRRDPLCLWNTVWLLGSLPFLFNSFFLVMPSYDLPTASLFASSRCSYAAKPGISSWYLSFVVPHSAFIPRQRLLFSPLSVVCFYFSILPRASKICRRDCQRVDFLFSRTVCVYHRVI